MCAAVKESKGGGQQDCARRMSWGTKMKLTVLDALRKAKNVLWRDDDEF